MTKLVNVIDYTLGTRDSETGVDTSIPFSTNFKQCRTLQQANVILGAYINLNYLDNIKYKDSITDLYAKLLLVNTELSNIESSILNIDTDITNINSLITGINNSISLINTELSNIESSMLDIDTSITAINTEISNIESAILDINNDIINLDNVTKFLVGIDDTNAKIKLNLTNILTENMIIYVKVPSTLTGDISQLSIDNGITYKNIMVNSSTMAGSTLRGLYLTFRYDGTVWQCENLNARIFKVETNGVIGATQYGGTLVTNLNNIVKSGFYTVYSSGTGIPNSSYHWGILHINSNVDTNGAMQRAIAYTTGESIVYERVKYNGVWDSWYLKPNNTRVTNLENVTKFITAENVTNADFKIQINNTLAVGLILNISFPASLNLTSNARFSIDNGVTYKNIINEAGVQLLGANVQNTNLVLMYDGTSFKKYSYSKSVMVINKTTLQNVTVGAASFTKILLDSTELNQGNGFTFENNQIKVNKKMTIEVNACADLYQFSGNCALAIIKNNVTANEGRICFIWQFCYNTGDNSVVTPSIPLEVLKDDIISLYFYVNDAQTSKSVLPYNSTKLIIKEL